LGINDKSNFKNNKLLSSVKTKLGSKKLNEVLIYNFSSLMSFTYSPNKYILLNG